MAGFKLVKPSINYRETYLEMVSEWEATGAEFTPFVLGEDTSDFEVMLKRFEGYSQGIGLKEGFVPHSTFWLIKNDIKVLGAVNIRHRLNEYLSKIGGHIGYGIRPSERNKGYATEMLRLALLEAKKLGTNPVLVVCAKENVASARVIQKNGGIFESEVVDQGEFLQRYWICIT